MDWTQLDHVTDAVATAAPQLDGIRDAAPNASFRVKGLKLAREPHRYSGRTSMRANLSVHEPRAPQDADTAFAFSMEGYAGSVEPRQQIPFAWSPGWNSPQAWNKFQDEVGGHLRAGDPGVRLIESQGDRLTWFAVPTAAVRSAESGFQAVPLYHLFGSEETSSRAEPVRERIPAAYVALAKADADRLGVNEGACCACRSLVRNCACRCRSSPSCRRVWSACPPASKGFRWTSPASAWKDCRRPRHDLAHPHPHRRGDRHPQGHVILLAVVICGGAAELRRTASAGTLAGPSRPQPGRSLRRLPAWRDMLKMFFKEDWTPPFADKMIFALAPVIAMGSLLVAFSVIPITPTWGVADLNVGLLFFFAMAGVNVYAVLFAGWASNNKFSLLGAMRASAQTLSYEVFMGLSVMGIVAVTGSFNMRDIVEAQHQGWWFIIPQFFGFCTFFIAGIAVTHRHPFDQPEAEQELADGYHIEYAGMKWGMFFVGEYIGIVLISALLVTLFFGGWHGPFLDTLPWLSFFWFALKTAFFIMIFILLRASIPRPRYDQVMAFSWKFCLPLTLINLLVTGAVVLYSASPAIGQ